MKIESYTMPKSSFLAQEKDMELIVNMIMKKIVLHILALMITIHLWDFWKI